MRGQPSEKLDTYRQLHQETQRISCKSGSPKCFDEIFQNYSAKKKGASDTVRLDEESKKEKRKKVNFLNTHIHDHNCPIVRVCQTTQSLLNPSGTSPIKAQVCIRGDKLCVLGEKERHI
jgi:Fe-S-cluster-containing dehydrogenase component